ncbi:UNKNOWN [Stylonychia lemnae]|uniref:Uncharacterized protein n=1 Tax=Stylonychia lemnae TaxID=5949 RepID=A0A078AL63_STYLE|nr:UNKNOWN [Stylonychia lemnae]|eukprot:CDW82157.1 UNKNOWN [Stylonychia lemnae]
MEQWDTEENSIRPIQTINKAENFLNYKKTNNNERPQNYHSDIQVTQNSAGKFKNYLSNNVNNFPPKSVNIDVTNLQNFKANQHFGDDDMQKVQLRPMQKINQNNENLQPSSVNFQQQPKQNTQIATFQSRAFQRCMNTSQSKITNTSPRQEDEQIDPVYKKMFKNLVKARDRSPQICVQTEQLMKKYPNNPDQLKTYFSTKNDDQNQQIREINKSCSQRLLEKGQTYQLKREILKKYEEVSQMKDCLFRPQTNRSTSPKRNFQDYIRDQQQFQLSKQRKIQEKIIQIEQDEQEKNNATLICKGSQKLLQNNERYKNIQSPSDVSSNLYEQGKNKLIQRQNSYNLLSSTQSTKHARDNSQSSIQGSINQQELFHPQINKKSQQLQRNESVENILYKDALDRRRNSQIKQSQSRNREGIKRESQMKSERYLMQSFKAEFDSAVQRLQIEFNSQNEYVDLFRELGFINELNEKVIQEQISIIEDSCISTLFKFSQEKQLNVYYLMLAIMNINPNKKKGEQDHSVNDFSSFEVQSQSKEQVKQVGNNTIYENEEYMYGASNYSPPYRKNKKDISGVLNSNIIDANNGLLILNDEQVKIVHRYFLPLYYQRKEHLKHRRKQSSSPQRVEPSFKPALTSKTVQLADKVLKKLKNNMNQNNSKHFDMLLQRGEEIKQKKLAKLQEKIETQVDSCTFKPQISLTSRKLAQSQSSQNLSTNSQVTQNNSTRYLELHNEHKNKKRYRQDKTSEQIEYEKAIDECTFRPNQRKTSNDKTPIIKGNLSSNGNSNSHIEQDTSRNIANDTQSTNNGKSPKNKYHREYKPKHDLIDQNISMDQDLITPEPHRDPIYVIAVEIEGAKYQIKIFQHDKPEETVKNFLKNKSNFDINLFTQI